MNNPQTPEIIPHMHKLCVLGPLPSSGRGLAGYEIIQLTATVMGWYLGLYYMTCNVSGCCSWLCNVHNNYYMSFPEVSPSYEHSTWYVGWMIPCGLLATRRHSRKRHVCIYVTKPQTTAAKRQAQRTTDYT